MVIDHKRDKIVTSHSSDLASKTSHMVNPYEDEVDPYEDEMYPSARRLVEKPGARARVPGCQCETCGQYNFDTQIYVRLAYESYDNIDPKRPGELDDHQYFLCASHLYGFILKDRIYGKFYETYGSSK